MSSAAATASVGGAGRRLGRWVPGSFRGLLAYSAPSLAFSILIVPVSAILPTLYAKERGVDLAVIGVILFAARAFDAISDPVIGYLSDRTAQRWYHARRIWIVCGAALILPACWFLFTPPENAGAAYFAVWSFALYVAWTMVMIPYTAWGAELSRDYHERSRIAAGRLIFAEAGGFLFLGAPILLALFGLAATTEMTLDIMRYVGMALFIVLPLALIPLVSLVPRGDAASVIGVTPKGLGDALVAIRRNKPLQAFLSIFLISEIGYGIFVTLLFLFIDSYLGIGAKVSVILVSAMACSLVSLPFWAYVIRRVGKIRAWATSWVLTGFSFFPFLLVPAGPEGFVPFLVFICISSFVNSAGMIAGPSVLGDIVDFETLRSGSYRAGNFFALHALCVKVVVAAASGIAFVLLDLFNYSVTEPETNDSVANAGLLFTFVVLPACFRFIAVFVLLKFPIDARRQAIVKRRLEQREHRRLRDGAASS